MREAAAETVAWKEKADTVDRVLTATQADLTGVGRERDFLATRLQEREDEVRSLPAPAGDLELGCSRMPKWQFLTPCFGMTPFCTVRDRFVVSTVAFPHTVVLASAVA